MVPFWVWAVVTGVGIALIASWPAMRRLRARLSARLNLGEEAARAAALASDLCFLSVAVAFALGGIVGMTHG